MHIQSQILMMKDQEAMWANTQLSVGNVIPSETRDIVPRET